MLTLKPLNKDSFFNPYAISNTMRNMEDRWPESKLSVSFSSLVELALVTLLDDKVQGLLESQEHQSHNDVFSYQMEN